MLTKLRVALLPTLIVIGMGLSAPSEAAVVFSDNFDSYAAALSWVPPANWDVVTPDVDLIGVGTPWDFFGGTSGLYVDLDGYTPGKLQTKKSFGPGTYTLSFELAGNQRGDGEKTTDIMLGNFSTSLTLDATALPKTYSYNFTTTTGGNLSFSDQPGGDSRIGNVLDNVTLSAPEPAIWAMLVLGFGVIGCALRLRRDGVAAAA